MSRLISKIASIGSLCRLGWSGLGLIIVFNLNLSYVQVYVGLCFDNKFDMSPPFQRYDTMKFCANFYLH